MILGVMIGLIDIVALLMLIPRTKGLKQKIDGDGKSYPELQILVSISDQFDISLDTLLKEDSKMVQSIDKERVMGTIKHEKSVVDFFTGAGTGIIVSCLFSPNSSVRTTVIIVGIIMVCIGWYKKSKSDKKVFQYIKEHD